MVEPIEGQPIKGAEEPYAVAKAIKHVGEFLTATGVGITSLSWWTGGGLGLGIATAGIGLAVAGVGYGLERITTGEGKGGEAGKFLAGRSEQVEEQIEKGY